MDQQTFDLYLTDRYDDQVNWHEKKSASNKQGYLWTQIAIGMLAVVTSVTTALSSQWQVGLWWLIPVITSALVAILTVVQKAFQFQERWTEYRMTVESLRKEKYLHLAKVSEYATTSCPNQLFVERIENILSRQNEVWSSTRRAGDDEKQSEG